MSEWTDDRSATLKRLWKDGHSASEIAAALGWAQKQMAEYLGCNQSTVSRIERGEPAGGPLRRMVEVLVSQTTVQS